MLITHGLPQFWLAYRSLCPSGWYERWDAQRGRDDHAEHILVNATVLTREQRLATSPSSSSNARAW